MADTPRWLDGSAGFAIKGRRPAWCAAGLSGADSKPFAALGCRSSVHSSASASFRVHGSVYSGMNMTFKHSLRALLGALIAGALLSVAVPTITHTTPVAHAEEQPPDCTATPDAPGCPLPNPGGGDQGSGGPGSGDSGNTGPSEGIQIQVANPYTDEWRVQDFYLQDYDGRSGRAVYVVARGPVYGDLASAAADLASLFQKTDFPDASCVPSARVDNEIECQLY